MALAPKNVEKVLKYLLEMHNIHAKKLSENAIRIKRYENIQIIFFTRHLLIF